MKFFWELGIYPFLNGENLGGGFMKILPNLTRGECQKFQKNLKIAYTLSLSYTLYYQKTSQSTFGLFRNFFLFQV